MKLKELEKRLKDEPTNLGLRVQVAGLMREAGRSVEAVEHYRFVALAYRDQGRTQQAIAVCRSILEMAPDDAGCQGLLSQLQARQTGTHAAVGASAPSTPSRPSAQFEDTPLPRPVPHHVADPTAKQLKLSERDLRLPLPPEDTNVRASNAVPSTTMDISVELETRRRGKIPSEQLKKLDEQTSLGDPSAPEIELFADPDIDVPTDKQQRLTPVRLTPIEDVMSGLSPLSRDSPHVRLTPTPVPRDEDDLLTAPRDALEGRISDEELTRPRERAKLFDDDDD